MARIRSLKPDTCTDERFADCSTNARLLFLQLQLFCDDGGVHPAKPRTLKAECFPYDDFGADLIAKWIGELIKVGLLSEFRATDGTSYWHVVDWSTLQKIEKPSYKYPKPSDPDSTPVRPVKADNSSTTRRAIDDGSPAEGNGGEGKGGEGESSTGRRRARKTSMPDDFGISERVRAWAADKGYDQLERHLAHFRGKAVARGYSYVDWDEALMAAVRDDWAKTRSEPPGRDQLASVLHADDNLADAGALR